MKQPEALRLADWLERLSCLDDDLNAAAELRRLHALNAELVDALNFYASPCDAAEITSCGYEGNLCCKRARAALSKAKES